MSDFARRWYQRPWTVAALLVAGFIGIGVVAFAGQVIFYMVLMKSGKYNPEQDAERQKQASISSHFANANVTSEDLARVVPKTLSPSLGSATATLQIVEFVDYRCPFSKRVAPVMRAFMAKHLNDTRLIIRDYPILELHPDAENVALAANCVFRLAPERYWNFHDWLFSDQASQSSDDQRNYAQRLGVDMSQFDSCVKLRAPLGMIRQAEADGTAAGIQGTPTFFFNGVKVQGALDGRTLELVAQEARARSVNQANATP